MITTEENCAAVVEEITDDECQSAIMTMSNIAMVVCESIRVRQDILPKTYISIHDFHILTIMRFSTPDYSCVYLLHNMPTYR